MRVGADERVRIENVAVAEHAFGEILEIHLVHDADAGRDESESLESLLAPFEEFVALAVALEFHVHVQFQRDGGAGEVDLHRVIDDEINRHERLDDFRIAADARDRAAHRCEIDDERDAGEILQDDPCDHERDFLVSRLFGVPIRERFDVFALDFFAVAIAQDGLEHDSNADWQARDFAEALLLERGEGVEATGAAEAGVELLQGGEGVLTHAFRLNCAGADAMRLFLIVGRALRLPQFLNQGNRSGRPTIRGRRRSILARRASL